MKYLKFDSLVISDRDIIDLLDAQKGKISKEKLLDFLQERGIFCSENETRNALHERIAALSIDWFLIEDILSLAASKENFQKVTATNFTLPKADALETTLENLKSQLSNKDFIVDKLKNGNYEIQYKVDKIEKNNARLIQRTSKDEKISINLDGDQATIVNTVGEGTDTVVQTFFNELERNSKTEIKNTSINFSSIIDNTIINKYFLDLIKIDAKKYKVIDVIKLKLNKFNSNVSEELELEDVDITDELNSDPDKQKDELDKEDIKSALISGSSLLASNLFKVLSNKGYFISSIAWLVLEKTGEKRKIEYSSGFTDPDKRDIFTFESKGFFEINSATQDYKKNRTTWKSNQRKMIEFAFQKYAFSLFQTVIEKVDSNEGSNE
ncbi:MULTISPECIES: hypothetical protein [Acinetobacter]|uniref:Uncharacterized protein n=1 Tax=Acinetobacter baylyi (strain ATCC 33305 / BD413 / ADP1) TaxID=62977 RepID=Q6FAC2_ACIAD|nr:MULTISPECIES: hypothetical protein [Acinetobacter]ENV53927.1 hypothetical protein F952_01980 [Acinetobacter baylyi DSM 14961 = CIP 107474]KAF2373110.1 hypothetical protein BSL88_00270 [Acinetobacter baylyi]KAF2374476.1 hypothetical protein BSL67_07650 [Acinetobacter baylyi]KAF2377153.1 hypothetical protein BSN81_09815 [Acinetobacter baylyi]KAF2380941.1 hypothetical protein BSN83_07355 [Acinetobacter baylyi]